MGGGNTRGVFAETVRGTLRISKGTNTPPKGWPGGKSGWGAGARGNVQGK